MSQIIVLVKVGYQLDRNDLEYLVGTEFKNINALRNHLFKLYPKLQNSSVLTFQLTDFMDCWNDQDDDTPNEEKISIDDHWCGIVKIVNE